MSSHDHGDFNWKCGDPDLSPAYQPDDWIEANNAAIDGIGDLVALADRGCDQALVCLRDIALGIVRRLHPGAGETVSSNLMKASVEFPVILPAGNEARRQAVDDFLVLPIGAAIGFPRSGAKKTGAAYDDSPAGFWREIHFWLSELQKIHKIGAERGGLVTDLPGVLSDDLLRDIVALPEFGADGADPEAMRQAWLDAAVSLVSQNSDLLPDWLRVRAANTGKGLPSLVRDNLQRGIGYCWHQ